METIDRCPRCNARLPRRLHFTHPDDGPALLFAGIATAAGTMGLLFAILHTIIWPDTPLNRVGMGAALYGILWTEFGLSVSIYRYWFEERREPWDAPHTMEQGQAADRIVPVERTPTSARSLVRPPAPPGINEYQAWILLREIARERETLSEETAKDYRVVNSRENYERLIKWLVDEELYEVNNRSDRYQNRNGGDITDYCRSLIEPEESDAQAPMP